MITITGDRSSLKELVEKVRLAYNEVVSFIDDQQLAAKEKNPASIGRDPLVRDLRSQLARVLNTERTIPGGLFTAVSQVGLGFSRTGQLEFNQAEFDSALDRDAVGVQNLFRGSGAVTGAFSDLSATIASYTSAGGLLPTAQTRLNDQVLKIGQRILRLRASPGVAPRGTAEGVHRCRFGHQAVEQLARPARFAGGVVVS